MKVMKICSIDPSKFKSLKVLETVESLLTFRKIAFRGQMCNVKVLTQFHVGHSIA